MLFNCMSYISNGRKTVKDEMGTVEEAHNVITYTTIM
jgi:hypothetical protein